MEKHTNIDKKHPNVAILKKKRSCRKNLTRAPRTLERRTVHLSVSMSKINIVVNGSF